MPLPQTLEGTYGWNSNPTIQDNLTTQAGYQFGVFVNSVKQPQLIRRQTVQAYTWERFDLSTIAGNPLTTGGLANDAHNYFSVGVDPAGGIHVAGNMHNVPLRYVRSTGAAYDHTVMSAGTMVGTNEDSVTYPQFVRLSDRLLFFYRNGASGSGDVFCNRYDHTTQMWSRVAFVLAGGTESPYVHHIAVDALDRIHVTIVWRNTSDPDTNNDVSYLRSDDGGATWRRTNGAAYDLPVTHAQIELVDDTATTGSGLLNSSGLVTDEQNRPHVTYLRYDSNGLTQVFHAYHNGTAWIVAPVTTLTQRIDLGASIYGVQVARPSIVAGAGRVWVLYKADEQGNDLRALDVTPGRLPRKEVSIAEGDLLDYEPTFDTRAARELGVLNMIVVSVRANGLETGDVAATFQSRVGSLLSLALTDLAKLT